MLWLAILLGFLVLFLMKNVLSARNKGDLDLLPGPRTSFWGELFSSKKSDGSKVHLKFKKLAQQYGSMFKLSIASGDVIFLSDHDSIYKVLVKSGNEFGGRFGTFRQRAAMGGTGILHSIEPDNTWKTLRKASHKHLKQFGDGLSMLESIIVEVAEDMFTEFQNNVGQSFNPKSIVFDTALNSIAFLITGERTRTGDEIVELLRKCESLFFKCVPVNSVTFGMRCLDMFPWLRHFGWPSWRIFQEFHDVETKIWRCVQEMNKHNPTAQSIVKVLQAHAEKDNVISERDIRKTALALLIAGLATTSMSFYAALNIFAHHPEIQQKMLKEIQGITGNSRNVSLQDRPEMPYTRAVLLEVLRYSSVVHNGVGHRTTRDTTLNGYRIPANTKIITILYNMHHDEDFWGDPECFRPERFLDDDGDLLPADHSNRTHLMPFGAGVRVCLGESLAMTRLFLWITTTIQRFRIEPAPGNKSESIRPESYTMAGIGRPVPYQVIFHS